VVNALEFLNYEVSLVDNPRMIEESTTLILPGVGNFGGVMSAINKLGITHSIASHLASNRSLLGICAGMQILFESSVESEGAQGFGYFRGVLDDLSHLESEKVTPSIGWNFLDYSNSTPTELQLKEAYFVHKYFASEVDPDEVLATYSWNGHEIPAHVGRGKVHGVQFHPEKSRTEGLIFLDRVLKTISD
jgi:glutamine amidotransferase